MKWKMKIILLGIIISLVLCNLVIASNTANSSRKITLTFEPPMLYEEDGFLSFDMNDEAIFHVEPGCPLLPEHVVTMDFPLSTQIDDILISNTVIEEMAIGKKIRPAPQPTPLGHQDNIASISINYTIYGKPDPYPDTWFTHTLGGGLYDGKINIIL